MQPSEPTLPHRLIEVDLPIKVVSAEGAREKATRRGNISTLHLWWARRPLAACRAVVLASLLPDPADGACPLAFREQAGAVLAELRDRVGGPPRDWRDPEVLREALLEFIALFANHERASDPTFIAASRRLISAGHAALAPNDHATRPLVVDSFAGGGSIPFEALRVGADAYASDLNPVAVLLNRIVLAEAPAHGEKLQAMVRAAGAEVESFARDALDGYYPRPTPKQPIAYLWARWISCEGPGCGATVPLLRSRWLMKRKASRAALEYSYDRSGKLQFSIAVGPRIEGKLEGTVKQGAATCPRCGYSTQKENVRRQVKERRGATADALLLAVVETTTGETGRSFRLPLPDELAAFEQARAALATLKSPLGISPIPDEPIPQERVWKNNPIRVHLYGMTAWGDLYSPRQALALGVFANGIHSVVAKLAKEQTPDLACTVGACLALALDRMADHLNSLCTWNPIEPKLQHLFGRQAIPFFWDFAEANPLGGSVGDWSNCVESALAALETAKVLAWPGNVQRHSAAKHALPDDSVHAFITDPPYYDAVPYATLADFFYVWLKRSLDGRFLEDFRTELTEKKDECVVDEAKGKGPAFFENMMHEAMCEGRRVTRPDGVGVLVFAHKSTAGWESLLQAVLRAGWVITASWPINTEMGTRLRARNSAALASSIHLVLRPRETAGGALDASVGTWRAILEALPGRIRQWLPRLAREGVVGADAIFACIGPALELFSQYSRVEKSNGDAVELGEFLEQVWTAVAREALGLIFENFDATGLEADARLTAMWLWTLSEASRGADVPVDDAAEDDGEDDIVGAREKPAGFALEFDAARKIAQGLGAHLEDLGDIVEIDGQVARLRAVEERSASLLGHKPRASQEPARSRKRQAALFVEAGTQSGEPVDDSATPTAAKSTLDQVHQAMLLFGRGRGDALKNLLVDHGVGHSAFWKLAQALSALYPAGSNEKRWIDGVLARKKGMGF